MRFLVLLHISLVLCSLNAYRASAADGKIVSISKVTPEQNAANEYFQAKRGSKILWTRPALGHSIYDARTGITILESAGEILVVDRFGTIRKHLSLSAVNDPRVFLLSQSYLVYDEGALALAVFDPKTEGYQTWKWLRSVRRVRVFNLRTLKQSWEGSEIDVGLPISVEEDCLTTLKITNLRDYLMRPKDTPVAEIEEFSIAAGTPLRFASLDTGRREALDLYGDVIGFGSCSPASVYWKNCIVHVIALFGKTYIGSIDGPCSYLPEENSN